MQVQNFLVWLESCIFHNCGKYCHILKVTVQTRSHIECDSTKQNNNCSINPFLLSLFYSVIFSCFDYWVNCLMFPNVVTNPHLIICITGLLMTVLNRKHNFCLHFHVSDWVWIKIRTTQCNFVRLRGTFWIAEYWDAGAAVSVWSESLTLSDWLAGRHLSLQTQSDCGLRPYWKSSVRSTMHHQPLRRGLRNTNQPLATTLSTLPPSSSSCPPPLTLSLVSVIRVLVLTHNKHHHWDCVAIQALYVSTSFPFHFYFFVPLVMWLLGDKESIFPPPTSPSLHAVGMCLQALSLSDCN